MEVLGHVRSSIIQHTSPEGHATEHQRLYSTVRQAETLALLRSVWEAHMGTADGFPLQLRPSTAPAGAHAEWARVLTGHPDGQAILQCVEPILQDLSRGE